MGRGCAAVTAAVTGPTVSGVDNGHTDTASADSLPLCRPALSVGG